MNDNTRADQLLRWCAIAAVAAIVLIIIIVQSDLPHTTFNSVIDGARFIAAVAAVWFGSIVIFERRLARSVSKDNVIIDLREVDLRTTAPVSRRPGAHNADVIEVAEDAEDAEIVSPR